MRKSKILVVQILYGGEASHFNFQNTPLTPSLRPSSIRCWRPVFFLLSHCGALYTMVIFLCSKNVWIFSQGLTDSFFCVLPFRIQKISTSFDLSLKLGLMVNLPGLCHLLRSFTSALVEVMFLHVWPTFFSFRRHVAWESPASYPLPEAAGYCWKRKNPKQKEVLQKLSSPGFARGNSSSKPQTQTHICIVCGGTE